MLTFEKTIKANDKEIIYRVSANNQHDLIWLINKVIPNDPSVVKLQDVTKHSSRSA